MYEIAKLVDYSVLIVVVVCLIVPRLLIFLKVYRRFSSLCHFGRSRTSNENAVRFCIRIFSLSYICWPLTVVVTIKKKSKPSPSLLSY